MVVAVQVGTGFSKTKTISEAIQKSNATTNYVYFKLREAPLFTPPKLPDLKCEEKANDMEVGLPAGLTVTGRVKGIGPKCRNDHPEKAEYELKLCSFDEAKSCLTTLYKAWAACTVNIYVGSGRVHQGGYLATIMCDTCMNTKLSSSGTFNNELITSIDAELVDCGGECRQSETYQLCEDVCDNEDDNTHKVCQDALKICNDAADLNFNICKGLCPPIDTACLDMCQTTFDNVSASCVSDEATCFGQCGNDITCQVQCTIARADCQIAATAAQVACVEACTGGTNGCLDTCTSVRSDAKAICGTNNNNCLAPLDAGSVECWTTCDEFLAACTDACDWGKDLTKKAHDLFKNSPHPRDAAKKKAKGDRKKQAQAADKAREEEAQQLAEEIVTKFGSGA